MNRNDTTSTVRFGDMVQNINERILPEDAEGLPYVGLEHLDPETLKIRRWGTPDEVEAQKLRFYTGDIIFGKRRYYQKKLAVADFDGICSAHAMVLRARSDVVLPEFLPFFMQSEMFFERAMAISVGSLSPTINWSTLAKQEFPLPPTDEQRRIAEILWALEDVIDADSNVVDEIERTIRVLRVHLFGPNSHNTEFKLADLCDDNGIQIGPFGSQLHAADYVSNDSGVPVIMPSDMETDEIVIDNIARISEAMATQLMRHRIKAGDILLPRRGDLTKRAYVRPEQEGWMCGTGSIRIRVSNLNIARAIFHALSSKTTEGWLERAAVATTMPNLNTEIVMQIPIFLPEDEHTIILYSDKIEQAFSSHSVAFQKVNADNLLKKKLIAEILKV